MWYTLCTYYRGDAVNYARQYANNYNPYYRDFSNEGGDCANFCSQAIYDHTHEVIVDTPGTPPLVDGHTDDWLQHPLPVGSYHLYHLYDQYYVGGP